MELDRHKLLEEVRKMAAGHLGRLVARVMDQTDDALFSMADKAETNQLQSLYFDAMREVRLKRPAIETVTRERFLDTYDERLEGPSGQASPGSTEGGSLGLVDLDELEESLAVDNMVGKLREGAHEALAAFELRMGYLLGRDDMAAGDDPLAPEVYCRAFQEGCGSVESGIEVKLIVLKLFDRYAFRDIVDFYDQVNAYLAEQGVLRELPVRERQVKNPPAPQPTPEAAADPASEAPPAAPGAAGEGDVFTVLQRLLGGGGAGVGGGLGPGHGGMAGAGGGAGSGGPGAGGGGRGAISTGQVVADLTAVQRGGHAAGVLAGVGGDLGPVAADGAPVNVLQSLRGAGALGTGTADAATLDIVALMFDYILEDDALPDVARAQLGRLQIPMLKVALLDRSVFSNRGHPARALLDTLAAASVGLREEEAVDRPLLGQIAAVVQRVLDEFEENLGLFKELLQEFQDFLAAELAAAEAAVSTSASDAADEERRAVARDRAEEAVRKRLDRPLVPVLVGRFFDQTWRRVLEQTALEEGRGAGDWKLAVETMDILLWSLEPKGSASERRRLVGLLPELLRRLNDGCRRAGVAAQVASDFISELAPLHARAVKPPGEVGEGHGLPVLEDAPESVSAAPEEPAPLPEPDPEFLAIVRELDRGTWLEFDGADGGGARARLSWVSSISGRYLFTDRQGFKVLDRTPRELALELAADRARLIDDEPLFDRAVSTLIDELEAAAA